MKLLFFPKCPTKKMTLFLVITLTLCVAVHIRIVQYIVDYVNTMASILSHARHRIYEKSPENGTKYILAWNSYYLLFKNGRSVFPELNCSDKCEFTDNRDLIEGGYINFDALLFDQYDLVNNAKPEIRLPSQLYIFTTIESSHNFPACELYNDNFFNWTSTYRLDSTVPWKYFVVRNRSGAVVAPRLEVQWELSSDDAGPEIKAILARKTKTAAWLVSHCRTESLRDEYLSKLQEHLYHFDLNIDVYGSCTKKHCDKNDCEEMLKNDYFFYFAFENSFSEDYVTEKVLHGYNNYAVPIVYGGANYSRFLPPGSYINARKIHPYLLAYTMNEMVKDITKYEAYFRWTNLYTIGSEDRLVQPYSPYHPLCDLCTALHKNRGRTPAMKHFRIWWNGINGMKWCLSDEYWKEIAEVNVDLSHIVSLY